MAGHNHKKIAFITGPTNGIGKATAFALAEQGIDLYLLCRNRPRADVLQKDIEAKYPHINVMTLIADLGDFASVRQAAAVFLAEGKPLHLLINNAGLINTEKHLLSNGLEQMFAVNHLGHFLLTQLLLPRLTESAPARIINLSSNAYTFCKEGIRFDDLSWYQGYKTFRTYGHSKLANILFTRELARRLQAAGITAYAVHPGAVASELGKQNGWFARFAHQLVKPFAKTPLQGAQTTLYLANAEGIEDLTGNYFANSQVQQLKPWACDDAAANKLWLLSERLVAK